MAAVTNAVAALGDTANAATYAIGGAVPTPFTPTEGDLLVVFGPVSASIATGTATASANGITFTKVISAIYATSAHTVYCHVANQLVPASPVSMTVSLNVTGDNGTGAIVCCALVSGMTRTGLSAIKQSAKVDNALTGTTPTLVFGASCLTENPTLVAIGTLSGTGTTPPTSWTERADTTYITPTVGGGYVSRDSGHTGTTITFGATTTQHGLAGVELDTSAVADPRPIIVLAPRRP